MQGTRIFLNIPNILTIIRFLMIPLFIFFMCDGKYVAAVITFTAAGLTDVLDGYIARKYNLITNFGKVTDPIADKLMQITALVMLAVLELIPPVFFIIIALKELLMIAGGVLIYKQKKFIVTSNWYGKAAIVVFYLAVVAIILLQPDMLWTYIIMGAAVAATLFAFAMYIMKYIKLKQQ
jgi:cardiolipin synthase